MGDGSDGAKRAGVGAACVARGLAVPFASSAAGLDAEIEVVPEFLLPLFPVL
jgi:hypothetical protein